MKRLPNKPHFYPRKR